MRKTLCCLVAASLIGCAELGTKEATYACQGADIATTAIALATPGLHEANPLMAALIGSIGIPGLIVVKLLFAYWLANTEDVPVEVKGGINGVTCGIAVHNLMLL